jgi:hypothetical protein
MFISHEALKVKLPDTPWFAQNEGSRGMELNFAIPWFIVTLRVPEAGLSFDRTLIAIDVVGTISLYRQIYAGSYVAHLDVMLPGHMTQEHSWTKLEVRELWSAVHPHSAVASVWLVETMQGQLIQCPLAKIAANRLKNRLLVYSANLPNGDRAPRADAPGDACENPVAA